MFYTFPKNMYHKPHKIKFGQCHTIMATSVIEKPIITEVGTLTGKTGYTAYEYAVRRIGNIVHVKGYVSKASGGFGTSQVAIASVTNLPLPPQTTRFVCATGVYAYNATTCAYGAIDTSGNILILTPTGTHATVVLNFWYPIG